jgi:hypothetical protein
MKLWKYTGEELIGGAEITSDVILAPEIEMPWESDKVEEIVSMPNYRNVSTTLRQPAFEFKLGFPAFGLAG